MKMGMPMHGTRLEILQSVFRVDLDYILLEGGLWWKSGRVWELVEASWVRSIPSHIIEQRNGCLKQRAKHM